MDTKPDNYWILDQQEALGRLMTVEDDEWSLSQLADSDNKDSVFGVGSFRFQDTHGVVHRVVWTRRSNGWAPLCGAKIMVTTEARPDPGQVTCLTCLVNKA